MYGLGFMFKEEPCLHSHHFSQNLPTGTPFARASRHSGAPILAWMALLMSISNGESSSMPCKLSAWSLSEEFNRNKTLLYPKSPTPRKQGRNACDFGLVEAKTNLQWDRV